MAWAERELFQDAATAETTPVKIVHLSVPPLQMSDELNVPWRQEFCQHRDEFLRTVQLAWELLLVNEKRLDNAQPGGYARITAEEWETHEECVGAVTFLPFDLDRDVAVLLYVEKKVAAFAFETSLNGHLQLLDQINIFHQWLRRRIHGALINDNR